MVRALTRVVFLQSGAKSPGFYPHNRVETRVEVVTALKEFDAQDGLFKTLVITRERDLNDVPQELRQASGRCESRRFDNSLQFRTNFHVFWHCPFLP